MDTDHDISGLRVITRMPRRSVGTYRKVIRACCPDDTDCKSAVTDAIRVLRAVEHGREAGMLAQLRPSARRERAEHSKACRRFWRRRCTRHCYSIDAPVSARLARLYS